MQKLASFCCLLCNSLFTVEYAQAQHIYKHGYPVCGSNLPPVTGAEPIFSMPPISSPPYSTPLNIKSEFKPDLSPCSNPSLTHSGSTMPTYCLPPYNMCTTMTEVCPLESGIYFSWVPTLPLGIPLISVGFKVFPVVDAYQDNCLELS